MIGDEAGAKGNGTRLVRDDVDEDAVCGGAGEDGAGDGDFADAVG